MKSKFNNHTEQKIEILEEYIHVKVSGIITTGSSVENFLNISRIVEKTGKNKLLLESQFENTLSIDQTYQVFEELKELNIKTLFEVKTAFLPVIDQFEYYVQYTDALTSQNILAKAFKEKEIALDWLLIKT